MNKVADDVFESCQATIKQNQFKNGVEKLNKWIMSSEEKLNQKLPLEYESIRDRLQQLEVIVQVFHIIKI